MLTTTLHWRCALADLPPTSRQQISDGQAFVPMDCSETVLVTTGTGVTEARFGGFAGEPPAAHAWFTGAGWRIDNVRYWAEWPMAPPCPVDHGATSSSVL